MFEREKKETEMTHQNDNTVAQELVEKGLDEIPELSRVLINNVMQVERARYLQAGEYDRTEDRQGHSNGYNPKTVKTRVGEITFAIPQVREGGFFSFGAGKSAAQFQIGKHYCAGKSLKW